jgi:hypothetical protein
MERRSCGAAEQRRRREAVPSARRRQWPGATQRRRPPARGQRDEAALAQVQRGEAVAPSTAAAQTWRPHAGTARSSGGSPVLPDPLPQSRQIVTRFVLPVLPNPLPHLSPNHLPPSLPQSSAGGAAEYSAGDERPTVATGGAVGHEGPIVAEGCR